MKRWHHNSPAHAPHNETRNSCSHCADIPVLVPWFINPTAIKGNILCRPLGWQERGIKMHRCCDANSWSHVGEQNALRIRLQGKKGPPASAMRGHSWVANPGSHQNPGHHQAALHQRGHSLKPWARGKHIPALQLSFWQGPPHSFHPSGLAERKVRWRRDSPEFRKLFVNQWKVLIATSGLI